MTKQPAGLVPYFDPKSGAELQVDPWAANPLVGAWKSARPELYAAALADGEPPTLFNTGDLPPFTASGLDPRALNQLPWQTRHAAATAPTVLEVLTMVEADSRNGDAQAWCEPLAAYIDRVFRWITGANVDPLERARRRAKEDNPDAANPDDSLYDALFGAVDAADNGLQRRRAQAAADADLRARHTRTGKFG